ncbi:MAG: hypothetical protein WCK58_08200 [Chloroflexota bacterium]
MKAVPTRFPVPAAALRHTRLPVLAAVGVLLAHDAVFAAQYGLGPARDTALARTTHEYWPAFLALTLLAAAAGGGAAIAGVLMLQRRLSGLPGITDPGRPSWASEAGRLWPKLLAVVTVAFTIQENIEHVTAGHALPGLWVLSAPHYPLAIPVLVIVTGLLAAVGGWFRWRRETLTRLLHAARAAAAGRHRRVLRAPQGRWSLVAALVAHRWTLLRQDAGRAPPHASAA